MRALIIGAARSGIGCALLLWQKGFAVTLCANQDFDRRAELEQKGIIVVLNDRDLSLIADYDLVVKNPGIPDTHPLVSYFPLVYNEIEIASCYAQSYRYYAISGTNGKTTTTSLLHHMLSLKDRKALLAGNIGHALSECVYDDGDFARDVALEISAFQMDGTRRFTPAVYAVLNLTPDHLDRYASANDYYRSKLTILERCPVFVRNFDDLTLRKMTADYVGTTIDVSLHETKDVFVSEGSVFYRDVLLFRKKSLKILGNHNLMNAMFAAVMAYLAGVKPEQIEQAVASFSGIEHRIEYVDTIAGIRYYNDSKATNPESTEICINAFEQPIILLAGGYDKHISFARLKPYASRVKYLFVFGESASQIKEVLAHAVVVNDLQEAFAEAQAVAVSGDVVVLSPACASYDQFTDFEQRGTVFKNLVRTLN